MAQDYSKYQNLLGNVASQGFSPQEETQVRGFDNYVRQLKAANASQANRNTPLLQFLMQGGRNRFGREQALQKADLGEQMSALNAIFSRQRATDDLYRQAKRQAESDKNDLFQRLFGAASSGLSQYLMRSRTPKAGMSDSPFIDSTGSPESFTDPDAIGSGYNYRGLA